MVNWRREVGWNTRRFPGHIGGQRCRIWFRTPDQFGGWFSSQPKALGSRRKVALFDLMKPRQIGRINWPSTTVSSLTLASSKICGHEKTEKPIGLEGGF